MLKNFASMLRSRVPSLAANAIPDFWVFFPEEFSPRWNKTERIVDPSPIRQTRKMDSTGA